MRRPHRVRYQWIGLDAMPATWDTNNKMLEHFFHKSLIYRNDLLIRLHQLSNWDFSESHLLELTNRLSVQTVFLSTFCSNCWIAVVRLHFLRDRVWGCCEHHCRGSHFKFCSYLTMVNCIVVSGVSRNFKSQYGEAPHIVFFRKLHCCNNWSKETFRCQITRWSRFLKICDENPIFTDIFCEAKVSYLQCEIGID